MMTLATPGGRKGSSAKRPITRRKENLAKFVVRTRCPCRATKAPMGMEARAVTRAGSASKRPTCQLGAPSLSKNTERNEKAQESTIACQTDSW